MLRGGGCIESAKQSDRPKDLTYVKVNIKNDKKQKGV